MILLLTTLASAAPAPSGIQIRAFPEAVSFTEAYLAALDPELYVEDLYTELSCWDRVGIRPLALEVPVERVDLTLEPGALGLDVRMGTIAGDDMELYGEDADTFDACPSFTTELRTVRLYDGAFQAVLGVDTVVDWFGHEQLVLDWLEPPVLTGDLETDIATFPDTLVLWFVEDAIFETASQTVAEALPGLATDLLARAAWSGSWDGLALAAELGSLRLDTDALSVTVDAHVAALETVACEVGETGGAPSPGGRGPALPLDRQGDAHLGVGLTEAMLAHLLHASWEGGAFCVQPEGLADFLEDLQPLLDPGVSALEGWAALYDPPVVTVDEDRMRVHLAGLQVVVTGVVKGARQEVARVELDLEGRLVPGFDQALTAVTGSLRDLELDLTRVELAHTRGAFVEPLIEQAVERFAADWTEDAFSDVVLLDGVYHAYDIALLLDRMEPRDGGLELYLRLFDRRDPAVDVSPPDTVAALLELGPEEATLTVGGSDDREGPLAMSWQVDGLGWSDFALVDRITLDGLEPGPHTVEVVARDRWHNVDPTPARLSFQIDDRQPVAELPCGCAHGGSGASGALPLLAWLILRRRERTG